MHGKAMYLGLALVLLGAAVLASPTFGFQTIAADRTTTVGTADDANALVGFEATSEAISGRQDTATAFYLRNNANETLTLSTDNTLSTADLVIASDGSGTIAPGDATQVVLECNGGGSSGTATVSTAVLEATGGSLTVRDASASTTVDYSCTGGANPGQGFDDVSAGDVTHWTSPGDERQTLSFVPASNLQPNSEVRIDLSDAQGDGVDYMATGWPDVQVESGYGDVWYNDSTYEIVYQAAGGNNRARGGETVEISIGDYQTTATAGPFQVSFTRKDRGQTGTDSFSVVDDGSAPPPPTVSDVGANVSPGDERQQFTFTPGVDFTSGQLRIDLSDAQGDGVDYMAGDWPDVQVEAGNGNAWYDEDTHTIVYQNGDDPAGDPIEISVGNYATDASGGPYQVQFERTDIGRTESDDFRIQG